MADVDEASITGFLRRYSQDEGDLRSKLGTLPPMVLSEIRFGFQPIWGELICTSRLPEGMLRPDASRAVAQAADVAIRRGAKVLGLGALTSPATGSGLQLVSGLGPKVTLTNGNAYTAAVLRRNVLEASRLLGLGSTAKVAVIGATGSVGVPASHLLAECGFPLLLIGRNRKRTERLLGPLTPQTEFSGNLQRLPGCDVIVLLTADPKARFGPEQIRPGAVVIDCAQPANIEEKSLASFRDRGVPVVEGGLVSIPGYSCGFDFRLSDADGAFACLAETYLFACEGIRQNSVGRPPAELSRRLERIAHRRGVSVRPLHLRRSDPARERQQLSDFLKDASAGSESRDLAVAMGGIGR